MYLKNIELQGFKSFANKIDLKFEKGITGIVGPNGSGKSNIADAVRWVLGEQSAKQLRGAKMEDVIFAGTENRRPVGYSQVAITIDNHDMKMPIEYKEVTICRRVYRSGESEYSINGASCRLKDINELFLDTGVGKEGYSIIGQGQIDKILSTKPEERRNLFDEAAGIVKYKLRKSNAEKKLEEQKQNIFRVNDIISELEGQKETLYEQAQVAKEYLAYKDRLKNYEVNIFIDEFNDYNEQVSKIEQDEHNINKEIEQVQSEYETIKQRYTQINQELEVLSKKIDEKKDKITSNNLEKERIENSIGILSEQIKAIKDNNERINKEIILLKEKLVSNTSNIEQYNQEIDNLTLESESKTIELAQKEQQLKRLNEEIDSKETYIENIKSHIIDRLNDISGVKTKLQRYNTMLENIEERKKLLTEKRDKLLSSKRDLETITYENDSELAKVKQELSGISKKKNDIEHRKQTVNVEKSNRDTQLNQQLQQLNTDKSKYNALNEITEHYEGYNYSIRKVMEAKNLKTEFKGVLGVVADVIKVEKKYELAIETALGASVQNVITEDEQTAKMLINYLKQNKYGRVTFLPLTSIKSRSSHGNLQNEPGVIGYGSSLVQNEDRYQDIINYLLGRVVIVDHIDNGIKLAKKYKYALKIVTLSGDVLNPGGSLTGGSYKNKGNNFLSRKRDIEQLKKNITLLQSSIKQEKEHLDAIIKEEESLNSEFSDLIQLENDLKLSANTLEFSLKQAQFNLNNSVEEIKDINNEQQELEKQELELQSSIRNLDEELQGSEDKNIVSEEEVREINKLILNKKQEKELLSEQTTNIRISLTSTKQKLNSIKENKERIQIELDQINVQIRDNKEELEQNKGEIEEKEQLINNYRDTVNELVVSQELNKKELATLNEEKDEKANNQISLFDKREEVGNKMNLLEKEVLRLQNSKVKLELKKESLSNYMWDEYELTFNNAKQYKEELGNVSEMKKEINKIKDKIKKLGDVNVNSIEDYKMVNERYNFLTEQKEDLLEAEEKLKEVIVELNKEMTKQFKEKFNEIKIRFDEVFKELFGGGKGILQLLDEDNVLESGIKIIAQPPGKKLQSMMLLSGGERAFTAIALLFAIQSLKPSPFCVLDEIEAALDDSNVYRFAKYLQKLSEHTQFIVITHRRGTMEAVDSLYGITMQEKGVSTLVSVKLIEEELTG